MSDEKFKPSHATDHQWWCAGSECSCSLDWRAELDRLASAARPCVEARLLELAIAGAQELHRLAIRYQDLQLVERHRAPMETCPHPDCVLVREAK